jgi:hypothetical protein
MLNRKAVRRRRQSGGIPTMPTSAQLGPLAGLPMIGCSRRCRGRLCVTTLSFKGPIKTWLKGTPT